MPKSCPKTVSGRQFHPIRASGRAWKPTWSLYVRIRCRGMVYWNSEETSAWPSLLSQHFRGIPSNILNFRYCAVLLLPLLPASNAVTQAQLRRRYFDLLWRHGGDELVSLSSHVSSGNHVDGTQITSTTPFAGLSLWGSSGAISDLAFLVALFFFHIGKSKKIRNMATFDSARATIISILVLIFSHASFPLVRCFDLRAEIQGSNQVGSKKKFPESGSSKGGTRFFSLFLFCWEARKFVEVSPAKALTCAGNLVL